jgi:hypothetical protein
LDGHDDGRSRPGAQSVAAGFLQHGLGVERHRARREAVAAALLDRDAGDLRVVGAALAAGEISREHADIAARVHERLGATVREVLVDGEDGVRCIDLVDATLARHARALTVPELRRVADRIVEHLHPPTPDGAHERRYLNVSTLPDGSLIGRFACGPAQGLVLLAAIAAGAEPRPGLCVDADGVERSLPDGRSAAQRRMDALAERLEEAVRAPGTGARAPSETPAERLGEVGAFQETPSQTQGVAPGAEGCPLEPEPEAEPKTEPEPEPEPEGEIEVRRRPGERAGPAADVEIVVVATLDQLAVALALDRDNREPPSAAGLKGGSPPDVGTSFERGRGLPAGFARDRLGTPVHPKTLGLLACSSRLRRVLVDENGAVLDLGRARRLATAAQRRALLARDVGCVVPGCDISGASVRCTTRRPGETAAARTSPAWRCSARVITPRCTKVVAGTSRWSTAFPGSDHRAGWIPSVRCCAIWPTGQRRSARGEGRVTRRSRGRPSP